MFMSYLAEGITLRAAPDRRRYPRLEHRGPVQLDGRAGDGRDISRRGLSVLVAHPVPVGDIVSIQHSTLAASGAPVVATARVVWRDSTAAGYVIGLEFVA